MNPARRMLTVSLAVAVALLLGSIVLAVGVATSTPSRDGTGFGSRDGDDRRGWPGRGRGPGGTLRPRGDTGSWVVGETEARQLATRWLATNRAGAEIGAARQTHHGFAFAVTVSGRTVGVVMVDGPTGRIAYHEWSSPTPSART